MHLITAKQAADILGLRLPRLYELTRQGTIPYVRFGPKQIRFNSEALTAWVNQGGNVKTETREAQGAIVTKPEAN